MKMNLGRARWIVGILVGLTAVGRSEPAPTAHQTEVADGDPLITSWVVPAYPPELKAQKLQGQVTAQMVIDEEGKLSHLHVTKSSDPRFDDAVLKALSASVFSPALEEGKPVAAAMELVWSFSLPYHPPKEQPPRDASLHALPKKSATPNATPDPVYPVALLKRHLDGQVVFDLVIGRSGEVSNFKVLAASHPDFVGPAVDAIKQWTFHPAKKGDLPVKDAKRAPLSFIYDGRFDNDERSPLEVNGFTLEVPEGKTAKTICSRPPEIVAVVDPGVPLELLASIQQEQAEVSFAVNLQGLPEDIQVKQASDPALGALVASAVEASVFKPAILEGHAVAVRLRRTFTFSPPRDQPEKDEPADLRLIRLIKSGEKFAGPRGLDAKLTPLWRAGPTYPSVLQAERPKGTALIELVIDQTGRSRVLKIVSATRAEFGWAAAAALGQWVFSPPRRDGRPVDVRVKVPVEFSEP